MARLIICLCALALLVPALSSAGPRFGIEAGGSQVSLGYEDWPDELGELRPRVDFSAAATARMNFTPAWGFITGVRYSRLGDETRFEYLGTPRQPGTGGPATQTRTQQYLGIPLQAVWNLPGTTGLFLIGGTELAYLLEYNYEVDWDDGRWGELMLTDSMNRFNMTALGGLGVDVGMFGHSLEVMVRYAHGLVNTAKSELQFSPWKTREVAITLGFRL